MSRTTLPSRTARHPAQPGDRALRLVYAANLVGAGVPGLILLAAPGQGAQLLFGVDADPFVTSVLGAVWVGIAAVSVLGLRDPRRFRGVLAAQVVYKGIWVLAGALPLLAGGQAPPATIPFAVFFLALVGTWSVALHRSGR